MRYRRVALGISQPKLALALGVTFQQVQKYESGSSRISAGRLQQIAAALDTHVAVFFRDAKDATPDDLAIGLDALMSGSRQAAHLLRLFSQLEPQMQDAALDVLRAAVKLQASRQEPPDIGPAAATPRP